MAAASLQPDGIDTPLNLDVNGMHLSSGAFHEFHPALEQPVMGNMGIMSAHDLLTNATKLVCQRYNIPFILMTPIQKKFLTHYRCCYCGLLPLFHLNLTHLTRVRCRKCGQLVTFRTRGKYGKIRKAVAVELARGIKGDINLR